MPAQGGRSARYTFGSYEVVPERLELRKNGTRVRLREQPFRVLVALLERPGEVVTRDELQRLLWAGDTFVDFDKGLNTAVNHLRQVLCDSATEPRYIETVPKHGYRFVAEVREVVPPVRSPGHRKYALILSFSAPAVAALVAAVLTVDFRKPHDNERFRVSPLTSYRGVEDAPSFSPDGSQVAFARRRPGAQHSDICIQMTKGAQLVEIAATSDDEFSPAWSPDGSAIAYLRRLSQSEMDVMVIAPSPGEAPRRIGGILYPPIINLILQSDLLAWSPDGRSILVPHSESGLTTAIWSIDVSSGHRTRLTTPEPPQHHSYPRISRDGRWLAYQQQGGEEAYQVMAAPLSERGDPGNPPITAMVGLNVGPIGWKDDDLVILNRSNTAFELWTWNRSTRRSKILNIPELAGPGSRLRAGTVSRDGRQMAISYSRLDLDIWEAELSDRGEYRGSKPLIVSTFWEHSADFSRDGRHLVFNSTRSGSHEAWLAHSDGSHLRQVTKLDGIGDPRLSPDGREIVFNRWENGRENIFAAAIDSGSSRRITNHTGRDANARWSINGQWIYFDSDLSGRTEIWKIAASGGALIQVTRKGGSNPFESPDGAFVYFGRDDHVWRTPVAGDNEERLFPSLVSWASLAMGSRTLFFVRGDSGVPGYGTDIYAYELASRRVRLVAATGGAVVTLTPSPDERRIVYGRPTSESDLMLVEFPEP